MMISPTRINIIGGCGAMGKVFTNLFRSRGYEVGVFDLSEGEFSPSEAADADVVFFAVSIKNIEKAITEIGPHMRPKSLAVDICSVKVSTVEAMLKHCPGEVLGAHPLFGPSAFYPAGETFFICPGRCGELCEWFEDFLNQCEMQVVKLTADEHDRQMAMVQSLRHLMLAGFGATVKEFGDGLEFTGRWFGDLERMRENQASQPAELYADIALNNPHSGKIFKDFVKRMEKIKKALDKRDRKEMIVLLEDIL